MSDVTHPVIALPSYQCGKCGSAMHCQPLTAPEAYRLQMLELYCYRCGVGVSIAAPIIDADVMRIDAR